MICHKFRVSHGSDRIIYIIKNVFLILFGNYLVSKLTNQINYKKKTKVRHEAKTKAIMFHRIRAPKLLAVTFVSPSLLIYSHIVCIHHDLCCNKAHESFVIDERMAYTRHTIIPNIFLQLLFRKYVY